jgi:hypothetical protein
MENDTLVATGPEATCWWKDGPGTFVRSPPTPLTAREGQFYQLRTMQGR